eukprot:1096903-Rhodomonas_salina.1
MPHGLKKAIGGSSSQHSSNYPSSYAAMQRKPSAGQAAFPLAGRRVYVEAHDSEALAWRVARGADLDWERVQERHCAENHWQASPETAVILACRDHVGAGAQCSSGIARRQDVTVAFKFTWTPS